MSTRRSKLEIMLTVLSAVRDGVDKPTRIQYIANMAWNPTQRMLNQLVEQGLLAVMDDPGKKRSKKKYELTEKGVNVLRYFEGAEELLDIGKLMATN
jgi:predicted transcriptional regulator